MPEMLSTMLFFVALIPSTYLTFTLLTIFDYSKILRRGYTKQLKTFLMLLSLIIGYLFTSAFIEILERIYNLFV